MKYLLDTNIISETAKANPNKNVISWINNVPGDSLFISVLTLGEIRKGIECLKRGKKQTQLLQWLEHDLTSWFDNRVIPINVRIADKWGYLTATNQNLHVVDGLIAATTLTHDMTLVTRNTKDFVIPGLEMINPWE